MQKRINYLIGIVVIFLIWTIASYFINSQLILPDPLVILRTMLQELSKDILWNSLFYTLLKVVVVLFLTVLFGVFIGFIIGLNETLYEIFRPFVLFIQAFPIITWLALVMFIWGIGWTGPVVVSFLSLLPHAILSTAIGIQTTDKRLIEMAQVYNVKRSKVVKDIYLGSILPQFVSTIQVVIGNVWKVVVVSEYMCGDKGIGVLIAWARQSVSVEKVYAYTMIIITIGLFVENFVNVVTKKAIQKWSIA
ncbi:ABC transporter permease [Fervidobacterium nodosum]|uniref:Binding-protein-dependent transport systems inner membrane component n=1 Tax=Fervidobacterium nodosum (strain ATCC 35602 / DSM 5306 / Rt17-B1) TaxID=381764 RepID=A7HJM6_FERNB|nr:ABC transporter permease subunit [Fervidobacterium nodosum]ABS60109.1 binding-protein-dependent transport systems inner membrane component [Fervidobacterium nodosum Rt17-B1]PHJ12624.1 ABC transporter permease [Fervidobacterium sp. SC_NGM5_G05]